MENLKDQGFRKMLKTQFIKHTNACVENFLKGDIKSLFDNTKKLSKVVLDNFKPMIPEKFHELWKKGIETNDYYLKLCGSGGGGYILGFTQDLEKAQQSLKGHKNRSCLSILRVDFSLLLLLFINKENIISC